MSIIYERNVRCEKIDKQTLNYCDIQKKRKLFSGKTIFQFENVSSLDFDFNGIVRRFIP